MRYRDSATQKMLRSVVRGIVAERVTAQSRNAAEDSQDGVIEAVESLLAGLGLERSIVAGEITLVELATVFEECGLCALATPLTGRLTATVLLTRARGPSVAGEVLDVVGAGALVVDEAAIYPPSGRDGREPSAGPAGGGYRAAWARAGAGLVIGAPHGPIRVGSVTSAQRLTSIDAERVFAVEADTSAIESHIADDSLDAARSAQLLRAAGLVGVAQGALDRTVDYLKVRHQFRRPLGSFQAVQHTLADVWARMYGARTELYEALWLIDQGRSCARLTASAVYQACVAAQEATLAAAQFHGGIGYTREYGLHHYIRRAEGEALRLGGQTRWLTAVGAAIRTSPSATTLRHDYPVAAAAPESFSGPIPGVC